MGWPDQLLTPVYSQPQLCEWDFPTFCAPSKCPFIRIFLLRKYFPVTAGDFISVQIFVWFWDGTLLADGICIVNTIYYIYVNFVYSYPRYRINLYVHAHSYVEHTNAQLPYELILGNLLQRHLLTVIIRGHLHYVLELHTFPLPYSSSIYCLMNRGTEVNWNNSLLAVQLTIFYGLSVR